MIQETTSKSVIVADGLQRQWDIPFDFYKIADLQLFLSTDGENLEQIESNFSFNEEGNYFIYPTIASGLPPVAAGNKILLIRNTENTQLESGENIPFNSKDIERMVDNVTMQLQDLKRDSIRSVKASLLSEETPEDFTKRFFKASADAVAAAGNAAQSAQEAETSNQQSLLNAQNAASSATLATSASASAQEYAATAKNYADESSANALRAETAAENAAASALNSEEAATNAQTLLDQVSNSIYNKEQVDEKISVLATKQELMDTEMDIRDDVDAMDSQLQGQINAHATTITSLEGGVATINTKIPSAASSSNLLVTAQELLNTEMDIRDDVDTKDSELQEQLNAQAAAIAKKQDTLIPGANITIENNIISATGGGGGGGDVSAATETTAGIAALATTAEAKEGFDDSKIMTPLKTAQTIYENVGRVIQLGFDGVLENNVITFEPDTDTAYELKTGYSYEIDLLLPLVTATGELDETLPIVINNNGESIKIINTLNDDATTDVTVGDMKQVMKYTTDYGFRWIFNARLASTEAGQKVFVMPSTVISSDSFGLVIRRL